MKYSKKILINFVLILFLVLFLKIFNFFPYKLTKEFLFTRTITNGYVIKKSYFGKSYVKDMGSLSEWIINPSAIYGHKGNRFNLVDDYFYIDRKNDSVLFFGELSELNKFLRKKGYKMYDMSDSEKILHLERSERKYKY